MFIYKIIFVILLVFSWYYYKKFRESENCYIELYSKYKQQVSTSRLIKHDTSKKIKNRNKKSQTCKLHKNKNEENKNINNKLYIITSNRYPRIDYKNPEYIQTFTNDNYIQEIQENELKIDKESETNYVGNKHIEEKSDISNYEIEKNIQQHEKDSANKREEIYIENRNEQIPLQQQDSQQQHLDADKLRKENIKQEEIDRHQVKNQFNENKDNFIEYESDYFNIPELSNLQSLLNEQILDDLFENMNMETKSNKVNLQVN